MSGLPVELTGWRTAALLANSTHVEREGDDHGLSVTAFVRSNAEILAFVSGLSDCSPALGTANS